MLRTGEIISFRNAQLENNFLTPCRAHYEILLIGTISRVNLALRQTGFAGREPKTYGLISSLLIVK